jgi:hypothetical protein
MDDGGREPQPLSSSEDGLTRGAPMGLQPRGRPLQELPSPSVVASTGGIASLVWRSLLALGAVSTRRWTALGLEVFPVVQSPRVGHGRWLTTLGVGPSGESNLAAAAACAACCRGPSHEVSRLLQHDPPAESTHPRLASPGTFRLQGFAPSWRFPPRQATRPCSMPERSWSRMPFRAFPSSGAVSPLDDRCPPAVGFRRDAGAAGEGRLGTARPCPQGYASTSRWADEPGGFGMLRSHGRSSASGPCSPERVRCRRPAG